MTQDGKSHVGLRVRAFRERQGWSLRTLANHCGLSINAISRIERGENSPTVTSLIRLAGALAVPITDFFNEKPRQAVIHVKHGLGKQVYSPGFSAEHLGLGLPDEQLEPFMINIEPGCSSESGMITHPGQEFVLCMSGEVEYCVGDQLFLLQPGDSLLFEAMLPHSWRNSPAAPALLLVVFQAAQDNTMAKQRHYITG